ncbi:YCII-related domain protein [Lacunisphaera limnophila]|uniref:YCII-related domain protein n=1 Tax=Lacunisphaera limnophila TaxID=1838286 RepID=A0A1D8AYP5_9BACT|nr:YciI family protein [Lacunisphaera limnophila]AOS45984.1 YCII-related domain protein [Lacunisphaera limnophila]
MSTPSVPASASYMLIFRNTGAENYRHLSAAQQQELVGRWNAWFEGLLSQGKAKIGQPLEDETRLVSGPGGARIVDGPFPETKEAVGGFVTLQVADLAEATAIAQRHPGLEYGMQIEVRQMTPHCHLGVTTNAVPV